MKRLLPLLLLGCQDTGERSLGDSDLSATTETPVSIPPKSTDPSTSTATTDSATEVDLCAGGGDAQVRIGLLEGSTFVPWETGDDVPLAEDVRGTLGLPFAVEVTGLDQTDDLTALVDLYVEGALIQSALGGLLTDCIDGVGTSTRFVPLDDDVLAEDLTGRAARIELAVSDPRKSQASITVEVVLR